MSIHLLGAYKVYLPSLLIFPLHFGIVRMIFFLLISRIVPLSEPMIPIHCGLLGIGVMYIISC